MNLRAVFLDVGQTLLTEEPVRWGIYAESARRRGTDVTDEQMLRLMRDTDRAMPARVEGGFRYSDPWLHAYIGRIFRDGLGMEATLMPEIADELFARFETPSTFRLFDGARGLIQTCRSRGLVLGVISNWSARLPRVLEGLKLSTAFDFVLCSAIEELEKPDPAIFRAALRRAGVSPEEALHAGDKPDKDGYPAREVGIAPVLVDHGRTLPRESLDGIPLVGSLPELRDLILSRLS